MFALDGIHHRVGIGDDFVGSLLGLGRSETDARRDDKFASGHPGDCLLYTSMLARAPNQGVNASLTH